MGKTKDFYTEDELRKMGESDKISKLDVSAIPNMDQLTSDLLELAQFLTSQPSIDMEKNNPEEFYTMIEKEYADKIPRSILRLIIDRDDCGKNRGKNLAELCDMFDRLKRVKRGELDLEKEDMRFRLKQAKKYIPSELLSEEAKVEYGKLFKDN